MKTKISVLSVLFGIICFFVVARSNKLETSEVSASKANAGACYISKIKEGATAYEKYFYNPQNKLVKYIAGHNEYLTYEYDSIDRCQKIKHFAGGELSDYKTYEYNDKRLIIKETQFESEDEGEFKIAGYSAFSYNAKNQIIKKEEFERKGKSKYEADGYFTYEYDAKGNVSKRIEFSDEKTMQKITEYQYDDKKNPFREFRLQLFDDEIVSVNNELKNTTKNAKGNFTNIGTYTYTYNSNGYPTKVSQKIMDKKAEFQWEYRCK